MGEAKLISIAYKEDGVGQQIPDREVETEILVRVESINRREWTDAGRNGFNPEIKLITAAINYSGEREIVFDGVRYSVYRTYNLPNSDEIELYLERKAGVQNGKN